MEKKVCINDSRFTFTGRESSPRGIGYCADCEPVGARREGRDKTMWMVILKNAVPVWTRVPTELMEETPPAVVKTAAKKNTAAAKKAASTLAAANAAGPSTSRAAEEAGEAAEAAAAAAAVAVAPKKKAAAAPKKASGAAAAAAKVAKTVPTVAAAVPAAPAAAAAPKKPPTDFNVYMKYRMVQLKAEAPEMPHKEKFSQAAKDWAALSAEQKKQEAAKAHDMFPA